MSSQIQEQQNLGPPPISTLPAIPHKQSVKSIVKYQSPLSRVDTNTVDLQYGQKSLPQRVSRATQEKSAVARSSSEDQLDKTILPSKPESTVELIDDASRDSAAHEILRGEQQLCPAPVPLLSLRFPHWGFQEGASEFRRGSYQNRPAIDDPRARTTFPAPVNTNVGIAGQPAIPPNLPRSDLAAVTDQVGDNQLSLAEQKRRRPHTFFRSKQPEGPSTSTQSDKPSSSQYGQPNPQQVTE